MYELINHTGLQCAAAVKAALEKNANAVVKDVDPQSYRRKVCRQNASKPRVEAHLRRKISEDEGDALLAKHAPHWREHLGDGHVLDHILNHV